MSSKDSDTTPPVEPSKDQMTIHLGRAIATTKPFQDY